MTFSVLSLVKKVVFLVPGIKSTIDRGYRYREMWKDTSTLEDIANLILKKYEAHDVGVLISTSIADHDVYCIEIMVDYDIPLLAIGLSRTSIDKLNLKQTCDELCSDIDKALFDQEVISFQHRMFAHLEENWPDVVVDLTLNNLYTKPKKK